MTQILFPEEALAAKSCRSPERILQLLVLCNNVARHPGTYHSRGGIPASLKRGQVVLSQDEIAASWGVTKSTARRSLEAFERDGLITQHTADVACVPGEPMAPVGTLITVVGLAQKGEAI